MSHQLGATRPPGFRARSWLRAARLPMKWHPILFAAVVATAAQLPCIAARGAGRPGPYTATADEMFYVAVLDHASRVSLGPSNPFDSRWRHAASPQGWLLPLAMATPVRLGFPQTMWPDALRWLGSAASAYALVRLGASVASSSVGAAAAVLTLLDPGGFSGKPLLWLLGRGGSQNEWLPLPFSRLYDPTVTLPLFLAAIVILLQVAADTEMPRRRAALGAAGFALVGLTNAFMWSAALGAATFVVVLGPRRRDLAWWLVLAGALLLAIVVLNGFGTRGTDLAHLSLRLGFFRTRVPQFLRHTGFWAGAAAAFWLASRRGAAPPATTSLGAAALGAWAVAMVQTPLTGWDVQSYHYALPVAPLLVSAWCTALWLGWRTMGRPRWIRAAGMLAVSVAGFAGATWAMRGFRKVESARRTPSGQTLSLLAQGAIPDSATVAVPYGLRYPVAMVHSGVTFAYPYRSQWAVPDSDLWTQAICAAVLTGEDTATVYRRAVSMASNIPWWPDGLPSGFPLGRTRAMTGLYPLLGALQSRAVAAAEGSADSLRHACTSGPSYTLALGRARVNAALQAARALSGEVVWRSPDGRGVWIRYTTPWTR